MQRKKRRKDGLDKKECKEDGKEGEKMHKRPRSKYWGKQFFKNK